MEKIKKVEPEKLIVTSTKDWVKKTLDIRNIKLPSGAVFKVKNIDLQSMVSRGFLPLGLINDFMLLSGKIKDNTEKSASELDNVTNDELKALDLTCRKFASLAIIEPRISGIEPTSDDVINVNDIEFLDVMFVFSSCVKGGASDFAQFFQGGK